MERKKKFVLALLLLALLLVVTEFYLKLMTGRFNWPFLMVTFEVGLILYAARSVKVLRNAIGEGRPHKYPELRLIVPMILVTPFTLYLLLNDGSKSVPALAQFSIVAIAPTLGGLVLAAAGNARIPDSSQRDLVNVAQKLISATILFIVFAPILFFVELSGGIDINTIEVSIIGVTRGISFWVGAPCFYGGLIIFLLGIFDLAIALGKLRITRRVSPKSNRDK